jgi:hypothetical protein
LPISRRRTRDYFENGVRASMERARQSLLAAVSKSTDFVVFPFPVENHDKGALDLSFLQWIYESSDYDVLMWARAYNGQFDCLDEPVSLRLTESDVARLKKEINGYHEFTGREE